VTYLDYVHKNKRRIDLQQTKYRRRGKDSAAARNIEKILAKIEGQKNEYLAFNLITNQAREISRSKGIEYEVDFTSDSARGRDLKLSFSEPIEFNFFIEIKSSEEGAKKHRNRRKFSNFYKSPVVVVNKRRSERKIIARFCNIIQEAINEEVKKREKHMTSV